MREPDDRFDAVCALGAVTVFASGILMCTGIPVIGMLLVLCFMRWCFRTIDTVSAPEAARTPPEPAHAHFPYHSDPNGPNQGWDPLIIAAARRRSEGFE